jgi:hypothetical protein
MASYATLPAKQQSLLAPHIGCPAMGLAFPQPPSHILRVSPNDRIFRERRIERYLGVHSCRSAVVVLPSCLRFVSVGCD